MAAMTATQAIALIFALGVTVVAAWIGWLLWVSDRGDWTGD